MTGATLQLVDVAGWRVDDYFATYPEGARDKRAFSAGPGCLDRFSTVISEALRV